MARSIGAEGLFHRNEFRRSKDGFDPDPTPASRNGGFLGGWPFFDFANDLESADGLTPNKELPFGFSPSLRLNFLEGINQGFNSRSIE